MSCATSGALRFGATLANVNPFEPPGADADQPGPRRPELARVPSSVRIRPREALVLALFGALLTTLGWYIDGWPVAAVGAACVLLGLWWLARSLLAKR